MSWQSPENLSADDIAAPFSLTGAEMQTALDDASNAVTATSTDTLSNKTLTAPKLVDGGFIADANGNELLIGDTVTSAVNEITVANAATAGNPKISATGGDTNIGLDLQAKGTGTYNLLGSATAPAEQRLYEDTDNGTNYIGLKAPASVASSLSLTLPATTGAGKVLTDVAGDGVLSMETPSGGGFTPKYARIARTTSDQTGISGSYAVDYLQYNTEDTDTDGILTISGDDVTLAAAGTYILLQHITSISGGFFSLDINGTEQDRVQTVAASYAMIPWFVITTGANQVVKFTCLASSAATMSYTDGVRDGKVNFVEILRIA